MSRSGLSESSGWQDMVESRLSDWCDDYSLSMEGEKWGSDHVRRFSDLRGIKATKEIDEKAVWNKVVETIKNGEIPMRVIRSYYGSWIECKLSSLGYILWPRSDHNSLKFYNRVLAKVLREHGSFIRKSNGVRWCYIPIEAIPTDERRKSLFKKLRKVAERKKTIKEEILVAEVWNWSWWEKSR